MIRGVSSALSRSPDAVGVLVVGGLLTLLTWVVTPAWVAGALLFPPLVVLAPLALAPAFVARGYLARVVAGGGATGNRDGAPPFVAWNELYRRGLKSAVLSALLLAPLALLVAAAALAGFVAETGLVDFGPAIDLAERALGPAGVPAVAVAGGGSLAVVAAAYLLAFAYVRPAALAAFAASGRLRDGLRPGRVAAVAGSGEYATAWAVAAAALGAGYALAAPFVPLVVGVAFVFAARVVAHALYGRGAAGAVGFDAAGAIGFGAAESAETAAASASSSPVSSPPASSPSALSPSSDTASESLSRAVKRAPDRPDGGFRRAVSEAPASVQTGRTVPLGDDGTPRSDADGVDDPDAFEWDVEGDADGKGRGPPAEGDSERRSPPAEDAFEWGVASENKS